MGTQGVAGSIMQIVHTDANGHLDDSTYAVPAFLKGSYKIAIGLESPSSGYYTYNWFYNAAYVKFNLDARKRGFWAKQK